MRRLLTIVGLLVPAVLGPAIPAAAHTHLVSSTPAAGAVLAAAPTQVVLRFAEPVDPALSTVQLAGPGAPARSLVVRIGTRPDELRAAVPSDVGAGEQVVLWRIAGDDGHAVDGRLGFTIASTTAAAVAGPRPTVATVDVPTSAVSSGVYATARWLALLGFCVLVGTAFFHAVCIVGETSSRGRAIGLRVGWWLLAASTFVALMTYGAAVSGRSLREAFDGAVLEAGATSRVGVGLGLRLLLVLIAAVVGVLGRRPGPRVVVAWAAITAATWSMTGHSRSGGDALLMVPVDVVHLVAAAIWLGGLVALLASERALNPGGVRRFSTVALTCVGVLLTTGAVQAWRRVGSSAALTDNGYGRLLLLKLGLVVGTLAAAAVVRQRLRRNSSGTALPLRRGVLVEAALGVIVLGVTSALVVTQPAREEHAQLVAARAAVTASTVRRIAPVQPVTAVAPFDTGSPNGRGQLAIEVVPTVGETTVHLAVLATDQRPMDARVVVALRRTGSHSKGQPVRMTQLEVGHYVSEDAVLPAPGSWEIGVGLLLPDGRRAATTAAFTVR